MLIKKSLHPIFPSASPTYTHPLTDFRKLQRLHLLCFIYLRSSSNCENYDTLATDIIHTAREFPKTLFSRSITARAAKSRERRERGHRVRCKKKGGHRLRFRKAAPETFRRGLTLPTYTHILSLYSPAGSSERHIAVTFRPEFLSAWCTANNGVTRP